MKPIKEQLPPDIEYWQIRMVVAILIITTGYIRPGKELQPQLPSPTISSINTTTDQVLLTDHTVPLSWL